jgi:predicted phage terminase large subunit-like protein
MTSRLDHLSPEQIQLLIARIPDLPAAEKLALLEDLEQYDGIELKKARAAARDDFLVFCHRVYVGFKEGPHHRHLRPLLHDMAAVWSNTEEIPPHALRLTVSMPPRFGKSESIAYLYVAWYLGHNPTHQIMMVTHTAELSESFGKKVRDLIDSPEYQEIFDRSVQVSKDKSAAGNWTTVQGGVYLALGVGGNAAGKGANLLVADDLVSEQAVLYGNPAVAFETAWSYMQVGPLQRLMPGGRIIMIGCLTGETRVLLADGTEKEIRDIRVGDRIATYENGGIAESEVTNWIEHRPDNVYKIRTTSGKIVRANERHPFLVDRNGSREWVRVKNLKVGDCMVQAKSPHQSTGASGAVLNAPPMAAAAPCLQKGCARLATTPLSGVQVDTDSRKSRSEPAISSTGTGFLQRLTTAWSRLKAAAAPSASSPQLERTPGPAESQSSTSTIATEQTACGGSCATTATLPSGTPKPKTFCSAPLSTYACTLDQIVEITADGCEPVFDIEVARTENFIANGVVSHNTRWGKQDPIAKAIQWSKDKKADGALPWHEVRFPAVMEVERDGKMQMVSLWPEQWPLSELLAKKAGMRAAFWAAQYMQEPTSDSAALLKREYWNIWPNEEPPECTFIIQTWDTAHEQKTRNDYSACTTWGVFFDEQRHRPAIILLDYWKGRPQFPELKKKAREFYDQWKPDDLIIEKKAAGAPLIQELRQQGLFVVEVSPSRGKVGVSNDKYARTNAVSAILEDGVVWVPDTAWARELMEVCADFPNGDYDDPVDCTVMAWERFRKGGFISLSDDEDDGDNEPTRPPVASYY